MDALCLGEHDGFGIELNARRDLGRDVVAFVRQEALVLGIGGAQNPGCRLWARSSNVSIRPYLLA